MSVENFDLVHTTNSSSFSKNALNPILMLDKISIFSLMFFFQEVLGV